MNGIEWLVEAHGCSPESLSSLDTLKDLFAQIIGELDLHACGEGQWRQFPESGGITGLCLLTESHLACHTFPEYGTRSFVVVGRIIYEWQQGRWNEWHITFNDGKDGWLSDAQDEYVITTRSEISVLPAEAEAPVGKQFQWNGITYSVTTRTVAHY